MIESGDSSAQLAYDVFIHRLRKYIGAYLAILGRTDVVSFTAGVGENAAAVRLDALSGLAGLGIEIDEQRNWQSAKGARRIRPTPHQSPCWWYRPTRSWRSPAIAYSGLGRLHGR